MKVLLLAIIARTTKIEIEFIPFIDNTRVKRFIEVIGSRKESAKHSSVSERFLPCGSKS